MSRPINRQPNRFSVYPSLPEIASCTRFPTKISFTTWALRFHRTHATFIFIYGYVHAFYIDFSMLTRLLFYLVAIRWIFPTHEKKACVNIETRKEGFLAFSLLRSENIKFWALLSTFDFILVSDVPTPSCKYVKYNNLEDVKSEDLGLQQLDFTPIVVTKMRWVIIPFNQQYTYEPWRILELHEIQLSKINYIYERLKNFYAWVVAKRVVKFAISTRIFRTSYKILFCYL